MKNKKASVIFLALIMLLPFLSACTKPEDEAIDLKEVQVVAVLQQMFSGNQEYSGNLEAEKETLVSAKVPGQVLSIDVNIGDGIKKGDVLARLTGEENFVIRNSASSAYQNSLLNLQNTDYLMDQKIRTASEVLVVANENLKAIKLADDNEDGVSLAQIEKLKLSLESLEIKQENLEETFNQQTNDVLDNALAAIRQSKTMANNSIFNLYSMNNQNLSYSSNDFRIDGSFVVKNKAYELAAKEKINRVKNNYYIFEEYFLKNVEGQNLGKADILIASEKAEELLREVVEALLAMNTILADAVSHSGMSSSVIAAYKASVVTNLNQVEMMLLSQDSGNALGLLGVGQAFDNLDTALANNRREITKQIEIAKNQLTLMKSTINSTKDDLSSQVSIAESQVKQAEAALAAVKQSKTSEYQQVKTQTDMALGNLNLANVNAANTYLKAPYDGVVVERLVDEGSVVGAGVAILKIAKIDAYKLVIYVPEREIAKIQVGQKAKVSLDSFPDQSLSAEVARISPKSEESSKKVRVEIVLSKENYLKIGMYARLVFENEIERQVLSVPVSAVTDVYGEKQVAVINNNLVELRKVELGMLFDDMYEIVTGLDAGDSVVINNEIKLKDGDAVIIHNL